MARNKVKPFYLLAAVAIIAVLLFTTPQGAQFTSQLSSLKMPSGSTGGQVGSGISANLPISFQCYDALTGADCGTLTVGVFLGQAQSAAETLTTTNGAITTKGAYQTGQPLTIKVSGNSKVTEYLPLTVPSVASNSQTTIPVTVYAVTLGAWSQALTGTNGATTFVSGHQYGLASFTGSQITVTDTITESSADAGYKSSYDTVGLLNQYFVVRIDDGAGAASSTQYLSLQGLSNNFKSGSTNYYFQVCPDGLINGFGFTQVSDGNYISQGTQSAGSAAGCAGAGLSFETVGTNTFGGQVSFAFTIKQGSLAAGSVETLSFKMFYYTDPAYFAANGGNMGPNAAQAGSTFTMLINP